MSQEEVILDQFGIKKLNPTKTGGREWFSNWHTATSHNWTSTGTSNSNRDPQDNLVDLHCQTGNKATVDDTFDDMTSGSEGAASNAWRLYINDPAGVWKWQPSVEMTVYYKAIGSYSGGTVFVHARLAGPTEHQLEFSCSASGHGYSFEIKNNQTIQIRKELTHPAYADNIVSDTSDAPLNVWIGMKFVIKVQENGDVKLECYRDMTDGAGGGQWELMVEHLDTGDMLMTDDAAIDDFNNANSGSGNCAKVSSRTARLNFPASSVYLRNDNFQVRFKKFSVREIEVGPGAPVDNASMKIFHSGGASNADPLLDKGGIISSVEINDSKLDAIMDSLTKAEIEAGQADYRQWYFRNKHATKTLRGVKVFMLKDTQSLDDQILIGKPTESKNTTVNPIADIFTAPAGVNFSTANTASTGLTYGDMLPDDYFGVWNKRAVSQGAKELPNNEAQIIIQWDSEDTSGVPVPIPPDPTTGIVEKIVAMADMSCSSNMKDSLSRARARKPTLCLWNGDLAYSSGSGCWITEIEKENIDDISLISFGNHDVDESESQPSTRNNLRTKFGLTKNYYTRTVRNMFILVLDSEANPESGNQVTELKPILESAANNPAIEWIIIMHHRPIYGPSSNHPNETDVRDTWDPIFDTNRVDLVITGHNHNAWHSNLMKYNSGSPSNPTVLQSGTAFSYNRGQANRGKVYINVGNGGRSHYSISSTPSYIPWTNDDDYGYCFMEMSNGGKRLKVTFYKNNDTVLRSFTIDHTI